MIKNTVEFIKQLNTSPKKDKNNKNFNLWDDWSVSLKTHSLFDKCSDEWLDSTAEVTGSYINKTLLWD